MSSAGPRFWEIFFEVFEALPRQGPGSRACAERALRLCRGLPAVPAILDLGCGAGGQTLDLAELTGGKIVAIDRHAPAVERVRARLAERGLSDRVQAAVGDMTDPGQPPESFDLVWSEGALYNIGIPKALAVCRRLLRPGGFLAFTDAVWRRPDPPPEVKAAFCDDYPTMGRVDDVLAMVRERDFELLGHFPLPDAAWWADFYTPMEARIAALRGVYAGDVEALGILDQIAEEPAMHRRFSDCYGYEFFVACRRGDSGS